MSSLTTHPSNTFGSRKVVTLKQVLSLFKPTADRLNTDKINPVFDFPQNLGVSERLAKRHNSDFSGPLLNGKILTYEEIMSMAKHVRLGIFGYPKIAPASTCTVGTYGDAWFRDTALQAYGLYVAGFHKEAEAKLFELALYANSPKQRSKYAAFCLNPENAKQMYENSNTQTNHPHIKAEIDETGSLKPLRPENEWCHAQLDAIGLWLWTTFLMANKNAIDLKDFDSRLSRHVYPDGENHNSKESILTLGLKFLCHIDIPHQADRGAWEEERQLSRTSSIAACSAALAEGERHFTSGKWNPKNTITFTGYDSDLFSLLNRRQECNDALGKGIPHDSNGHTREVDNRRSDATFTWVLSSLRRTLQWQDNTNLALVRSLSTLFDSENRGIKRYEGDLYLASNHNHSSDGYHQDKGREGSISPWWPMFDAHLGAFYAGRFIESGGASHRHFAVASALAKRSLAAIAIEETYSTSNGQQIYIPGGTVPEAIFYDPTDDKYRSVRHTPLFMAEAAYLQFFATYLRALGFERDMNASLAEVGS